MGDVARWPHDDVLHAWWVIPNRLLAGEYPASLNPRKTTEKLRLLVEARVDSIVDLTTPDDGLDPYYEQLQSVAAEADRQIRHFNFPIPDNSVIDHAGYDAILSCIGDEIRVSRRVYLHCWGGKGRTSTVVGCLLIDQGLGYDVTIARIAELRAGTRKAQDPCPESSSQLRVLRERANRR